MALFSFSGLSDEKIVELTSLSNASYAGESPPSGWTTLTGATLGFVEGFGTGTYNGTTYQGSSIWFGAPAARVYQKGSEITVSFRGTDTGVDYLTYLDIVGNNNYINAFSSFLNAVAGYASNPINAITSINVVGHSLGAAAANILRNVSPTQNGGIFDSATYFTVATPKVSSNPDILNIGFENDWVYKTIARNTPFTADEFFSTTDNIVLYDDAYSADNWPGFVFDPSDVSAHSSTGYIEAVERITKSSFYEEMNRDSVVIVVATDAQVSDKDVSTSDHFGSNAFFVGRDQADDILGGARVDKVDALGGDDTIEGGAGNDIIEGGEGEDVAVFSGDCSEYDVSKSDDGTVTIAHVRGTQTDGTDTLTNVEFAQFSDFKLDLTQDNPTCTGQDLAFVIDTTGSMFDDIAAVKSQATSIIDSIFDPDRGLINSRIAVVGYNDPGTSTILSFTDQPDPEDRKIAAQNAINSISVGGGGDFPELTFTGLLRALNGGAGEWREEAVARKIVLFGDATAKDSSLASQVYALAANLNVDTPSAAAASFAAPATFAVTDEISLTSFAALETNAETGEERVVPVQIFTVAIGFNSGTISEFQEIANQTGGSAFTAANASDIVDALLEVINLPIYTINAETASVEEGDSGSQEITFTVARDVADDPATVSLSQGGSADGADFSGVPAFVEFAAGETSKSFTVTISGDSDVENNETISVSISAVSEPATFGGSAAVLTILNDDEETTINEIDGTAGRDNLVGTVGDDAIRSFAGSYDKMLGDQGADQFIFGSEATNGIRERDVILDYEVGIDSILLEGSAAVASIRETSSSVVIFLEGDRDAIYVRGDGVTADNLTIVTDDVFELV